MKVATFFLVLLMTMASAFAATIKFESLASGQMRATGFEFTQGARSNQINFYKNGQYFEKTKLNPNGSFSYTSAKELFKKNDKLTVKVLQYVSNSVHFEKTGLYDFVAETHTLDFKTLPNGQMTIVGKEFSKEGANNDQVNFYNNGDYIDHVFINANGSFSYTAPVKTFKNGDKLTVKVLNYLESGKHFEKTVEYKFNDEPTNNDYVRGCYSHTTSYSNEALCLQLRVPFPISQSCAAYTSSYSNEAVCLKVRTVPATAKACKLFMGSYSNEEVCLRTINLSPAKIENCGRYTSSYSAELTCILNASRN